MPQDKSNNSIEDQVKSLAEEYKTGFRKHNYLDGFGPFTIFSEIADIKQEQNPQVHSDRYDAEFAEFYFSSLGSAEANMLEFGSRCVKDNKDVSYFSLRAHVNDVVNRQLSDLTTASSSLSKEPRFIQVWCEEMMKAGIRGLRRACCGITGLPSQYSEQKPGVVLDAPQLPASSLEQKINSLDRKIGEKIGLSAKYSSNFRKYVLVGFAGLYLFAAAASIGAVVFVYNAEKRLKNKEQEFRRDLGAKENELRQAFDMKIAEIRSNFNSDLESNIWNIVGNALDSYAPDIGVDLSPQERLPLVVNALEENKKTELLEAIKAEIGEINFWKLVQSPAGRSEKKE